jgi:Domain of unknown function (DUF4432)
MKELSSVSLLRSGEIARADTVARVSQSRIDGGPADGLRVVDVQMAHGLSVRILPDRGLDISSAWAFGLPIGWMSKVGEIAPLDRADGMSWIDRFTGGLLTTCGPDNIGVPSVDGRDNLGLHGSWSFLRAEDVTVARDVVNGEFQVIVSGQLRQATALGRDLEIKRTIMLTTGSANVSISDQITNRGTSIEPIPMLYHVNIGAPLWGPGSTLGYPKGTTTTPRNEYARAHTDVAHVGPQAKVNGEEYVFEREVCGGDADPVVVTSPRTGLQLAMTWTRASLPRFHQWIHPAAGVYALGIEPANASLAGRSADRAAGQMPTLEPDETREFGINIVVSAS